VPALLLSDVAMFPEPRNATCCLVMLSTPAAAALAAAGDSRLRSSYDADYTDYHKAPQQLTPKVGAGGGLCARAARGRREAIAMTEELWRAG
jgi:hypothetical protein